METTKIRNGRDYFQALSRIEELLRKGFSHLTKKEEQELELLSQAAETWELSKHFMPVE